jgi:hypothetical protein
MFFICCLNKFSNYFKGLKFAFERGRVGTKALFSLIEIVSSVLHFYITPDNYIVLVKLLFLGLGLLTFYMKNKSNFNL